VKVEDEVWTAVAEDGIVIKSGEKVRVVKVDGTILTVARAEEMAV
jgi:membrane protein implicated in regulation of membrane protease activity